MNDFRKQIQEDVKNVFLNIEEFAEEEYLVNGKAMRLIVDTLEYQKRQNVALDRMERIYARELMIYVPAEAFGPEPKIGSLMTLQKASGKVQKFVVTASVNEDGIYSISLEAYNA